MDETWWRKPEDLDEAQREIIQLPPAGDYLILGPPGSGKTNLLVLRGTYLHLQGKHDISLITFNRTLREFLAAGTENYEFSIDKIQTYIRWGIQALVSHGVKFEGEEEFEAQRELVTGELSKLIKSGKKLHKQDCILLDESQDYTQDEVKIFEALARQIFAVGDSDQQIYSKGGGLEELGGYCDETKTLKYHYRNGRKICRIADRLRDQLDDPAGMESTSCYDEKRWPSSAEAYPCSSIKEQAAAVVDNVRTQLRAYPDERIGVACPMHEDLRIIWDAIQKSEFGDRAQLQTFKGGYAPLTREHRVCATTVHGTKGMEFRALNIAGAEKFPKFRQLQKNLAYTGITRAKTTLAIYYSGALPGYLENAIATIHDVPSPPSVESLFKRKS